MNIFDNGLTDKTYISCQQLTFTYSEKKFLKFILTHLFQFKLFLLKTRNQHWKITVVNKTMAAIATRIICFTFITYLHVSDAFPISEHGIILDAGSSSTKIRIYNWKETLDGVPTFNEVFYEKVSPGISSFLDNISGIQTYINQILDILKGALPEPRIQNETPVYFFATAGWYM